MKTRVAPFRVPSADLVSHSGWHVRTAGGDEPLGTDIHHWDFQTELSFSAALSLKRDELLQQSDLDGATELEVAVVAHSDATNARGVVARVAVPRQERYDLALEFDLPGHSLGGRLDLTTFVLADAPVPTSPLGAARPSSVLWRSRQRSHLEGTASRFPTDAADFNIIRPRQSRAGWHLQVDTSEPEASFMSAVRLTLNSARDDVERLLAGVADDDVTQLMRTVRWDVTRQLVMTALAWDAIGDEPPDFESTSVSAVLRGLLAQIWPMDDPSNLRRRLEDDPRTIDTEIQHFARLPR